VRRYIYRFVDSENGTQVRQFPAAQVLETMRALHQASDRLVEEKSGADVQA
jgi:uncharacterized FlaG/YvyC family protein